MANAQAGGSGQSAQGGLPPAGHASTRPHGGRPSVAAGDAPRKGSRERMTGDVYAYLREGKTIGILVNIKGRDCIRRWWVGEGEGSQYQ